MHKRVFSVGVLLTGLLLLVAPELMFSQPQKQWRVNGSRLNDHLQTLHKLVAKASGKASRVAFSDADRTGRSYVINLMRAAGLETKIDHAGNIMGRRAGRASGSASLMLGSHLDSVPDGGLYDGPLGVMAAIEVAQTLHEHNYVTSHPLEIVVFQNEEGGKTGSRLLSGEVMDKEFDLITSSGKTIRDGIRSIGGDPDRLEQIRRRPGWIGGGSRHPG
ncbi:M20/M25/M40 family metallo-hydrolase [candidate division KSB1 bacterium]|nr:M20/M25/M40 family metallo-hydrolase [candidate division KSB1 bacterium]